MATYAPGTDRQLTDAEVQAQYRQRYKQVTGRDSTATDWKQASDYFGYKGQGGLQSQINAAFDKLEANYRQQQQGAAPKPAPTSTQTLTRTSPAPPAQKTVSDPYLGFASGSSGTSGGGGTPVGPAAGSGGAALNEGSVPSLDGLNSMIGGGTEGGGGYAQMMQPPGGLRDGLGKRLYPQENSALAGLRRIY